MKNARQRCLLELIQKQHIETQEELAGRLRAAGFAVTQATISRDIRELRLTKVSDAMGRQYYAAAKGNDGQYNNKYIRVLKDGYLDAKAAGNLIVIKTVAGMAMAVAAAIDALEWEDVLGCIAGDDTIFCAAIDMAAAEDVLLRFQSVMKK